MGRIVGKMVLTMPMAFSTSAQIIGSTSAPRDVLELVQYESQDLRIIMCQTYRLHLREIISSQHRSDRR